MTRERKMADDEVEQLLQAAQDEMILKLSVNSHSSRSYPDYLDPDLHSRFLALRSTPPSLTKTKKKQQPRSPQKPKDVVETPGDLMLRFSALKKSSLPSSSSVSQSILFPDEIVEDSGDDESGEDAQVEKLIQWAIDAARLDPSPPSDDESDNDSTKCVKP